MQATQSRPGRGGPQRGPAIPKNTMGRAVRYLWNYRKEAPLPYLFLLVATIAQLAVPHLVSNILDAVISGVRAPAILDALGKIPANFMPQVLPKMLESLKLPLEWTQTQLATQMTADKTNAPTLLISGWCHNCRFCRRARTVFLFAGLLGRTQFTGRRL